MPIWQFSTRPAVPEYWRCTPADLLPVLRKPVSSTISTPHPEHYLHRRYERRAKHFLAFTAIACTLICYRRLNN